ncbi:MULTISPECIES: FadR/GntR family transcriptional regulator [unclassified Mycobacterium]|uniref:FadR/GntR family transcriptional regulator n=1 Tax=unclassified Mycobacterium TaxID=2642494 RepID=UPI0029C73026|nr:MULTISPECIES: FCD domain-containing protein [unclassified Mycobacterium]
MTDTDLTGSSTVSASETNTRGLPPEVKLARKVAKSLEADILASNALVGDIYASEDDLRSQFGVGRAVVREAVRLLEHHGVARMRRGPYGGLVIQAPDARALTRAVVVYLEYVGTTVEDLLAARSVFEPYAAKMAADRISETDAVGLRQALEAENHFEGPLPARDAVHRELAAACDNKVIALFIDVVVQLTARYATVPPQPQGVDRDEIGDKAHLAHQRIVDAVIAGDPTAAESNSQRHLRSMRDWLLSTEQTPIAYRLHVAQPHAVSDGGPKEKLAELVARQLMAEIAASGVEPGQIYGSENELVNRLQVSRAVFREAVRLMEHHAIARMRRGPYGGLVVGRPDPSASVDALAVYLEYERVGIDQLREARQLIELSAVDELVRRRRDPDVVAALQHGRLDADSDLEFDGGALSQAFHIQLAELAGNPVLTLFLRIIVSVWGQRQRATVDPSRISADAHQAAANAHRKIAESILCGDRPLARRRLISHFGALQDWLD